MLDKVVAFRFGLTDPCMKDTGRTTKLMAEAD
jgi:hypothetical protein